MRKRFVPTHHYRDLHLKLQNLKQGAKSVEDYHKEMEMAMLRANIEEYMEATMARVICGLDREIANVVELQHYVDLEDVVHMAIKVEKQLKKRARTSKYEGGGSANWKKNWNSNSKEERRKPLVKELPSKTSHNQEKGNPSTTTQRSRDVKCFRCQGYGHIASQCPNKMIMLILDNGDVISEEETEEQYLTDDEDVEYAVGGQALVVLRVLHVTPSPEDKDNDEKQERQSLEHKDIDEILPSQKNTYQDPITRSKAKALQDLVQSLMTQDQSHMKKI